MAARVITVTSGKGGVGKTTATANIAVALASLGNKVVCIDADIGLRNLDVVMGLENRIVYDLVDIVEGRAKLRQAMIRDKRLKEELYLIPAAQTRDKTAVSPSDMVRVCDELRPVVDYVVIDSPAGIERGFRNAIAPADVVVIVTNPEVSSVRDADRIIGLIEAEGKGPGHLVINRVKSEMVKKGDMLSPEDIIDILAVKLIGLVPEDETILVSTNRGLPAALNTDDQSRAGVAFRNIARRITGENVPFMPMEEETGWLKRLVAKVRGAENAADKIAAGPKPSVVEPPKKEIEEERAAARLIKPVMVSDNADGKPKAEEKPSNNEPVASAPTRSAESKADSDDEKPAVVKAEPAKIEPPAPKEDEKPAESKEVNKTPAASTEKKAIL
ncbi:MAG: septum site-determining protein MinD [Anaerolineae bacterium]|nr:septum site-determining protein MinD [Anaerolineae bacterium]